jgi:hypothetical protein
VQAIVVTMIRAQSIKNSHAGVISHRNPAPRAKTFVANVVYTPNNFETPHENLNVQFKGAAFKTSMMHRPKSATAQRRTCAHINTITAQGKRYLVKSKQRERTLSLKPIYSLLLTPCQRCTSSESRPKRSSIRPT